MGHVPHLLVPGPWIGEWLEPEQAQHRHVVEVLRRPDGAEVSYTDGAGRSGIGTWTERGIRRGAERLDDLLPDSLTLAIAPPDSKDRIRWLVEKATELGVVRLRWLRTIHGQGRLPPPARASSWMVAALQQSRRCWMTTIDESWSTLAQLGEFVVADRGGIPFRPTGTLTVAIGPEGGWAPGEIEETVTRVSLGEGVLRTETAAIAAAAVFSVLDMS